MFDIIAHRGASYDAPENTIASAQLAWEQNADGMEIDIRITSDNQIVVIHDETTGRTAKTNVKIATSTFERIKNIDVGMLKSQNWVGQTIPTLQQMLEIMPTNKKMFIEFKCRVDAMAVLGKILNSANRMEDFRIVSFDLNILKEARRVIPNVDIYWLQDAEELDSYLIDWLIGKCGKENFNGLMVIDFVIDEDLIQLVHESNLKVYSWTINSGNIAKKFAQMGVDGIITDRPGWIRDQFKLSIAM